MNNNGRINSIITFTCSIKNNNRINSICKYSIKSETD